MGQLQLWLVSACRPASNAPAVDGQPENLPGKVRREDEKPGHAIPLTDFSAERAEKMTVAITAVIAEKLLTNEINGDRH